MPIIGGLAVIPFYLVDGMSLMKSKIFIAGRLNISLGRVVIVCIIGQQNGKPSTKTQILTSRQMRFNPLNAVNVEQIGCDLLLNCYL